MSKDVVQESDQGLTIHVKVTPKAGKPGWGAVQDDRIQLKIAAAPVDGQANEACILVLAKTFKCPKSEIQLLKGFKAREKTFLLTRFDPDRLKAWKEQYIPL